MNTIDLAKMVDTDIEKLAEEINTLCEKMEEEDRKIVALAEQAIRECDKYGTSSLAWKNEIFELAKWNGKIVIVSAYYVPYEPIRPLPPDFDYRVYDYDWKSRPLN